MGCVVAVAYGGKDCLVWAKKGSMGSLSSAETEQGKCLLPQAQESLFFHWLLRISEDSEEKVQF